MPTTTNYGWTTPADTDLVKDGASAIRTLGTAIDTTTKNLNPSTTLGDIEYRSSTSNTNTRLGIGTTGQVLTVSGGVPAWTTVSSGAMVLINRTAISAAATTTIDSLFSDTYENYILDFWCYGSTGGIEPIFKFRYGSTTHSANYNYGFEGTSISGGASNTLTGSSASALTLPSVSGGVGSSGIVNLFITRHQSSGTLFANGILNTPYNAIIYSGGLHVNSAQAWSGIQITSSSGTITGAISVYGLAKS